MVNISNTTKGIIGAVVLFLIVAALYPEFASAGDSLNSSGIPLGTLFAAGGVMGVILAAALVMGVYKALSKN